MIDAVLHDKANGSLGRLFTDDAAGRAFIASQAESGATVISMGGDKFTILRGFNSAEASRIAVLMQIGARHA
jgi:hypothetical protein